MVEKIEDLKQAHTGNKKRSPISVTHPHLVSEWLFEKNCGFTPDDFTARSSIKVWWRCRLNTEHVWQSKIENRIKGYGCPFCTSKTLLPGVSFATKYPTIAKEWHPLLNEGVRPDKLRPRPDALVWWLCSFCGHEWQSRVRRRIDGAGCPKCKVKIIDLTKRKYSYCLSYFDKTRNKGVDPTCVQTRRELHWRCPEGPDHVWRDEVRKPWPGSPFCPMCKTILRLEQQKQPFRPKNRSAGVDPVKTRADDQRPWLRNTLLKQGRIVLYMVDIVNICAREVGTTKADTKRVIDAVLETIIEQVADDEPVKLAIGTFVACRTKARIKRNPKTGKTVTIRAKREVTFKASNEFADLVCSTCP